MQVLRITAPYGDCSAVAPVFKTWLLFIFGYVHSFVYKCLLISHMPADKPFVGLGQAQGASHVYRGPGESWESPEVGQGHFTQE